MSKSYKCIWCNKKESQMVFGVCKECTKEARKYIKNPKIKTKSQASIRKKLIKGKDE